MGTPETCYSKRFEMFCFENLNPVPKYEISNPNRICRAYTKFEPEAKHEPAWIRRAYTNPKSDPQHFPNTKNIYCNAFIIKKNPNTNPNSDPNSNPKLIWTEYERENFSNPIWKMYVFLYEFGRIQK